MLDPQRIVAALLACIALALGASCGKITLYSAPADAPNNPTAHNAAAGTNGPPRDLSRDEAAGGHTLARHVGRSDEELLDRLAHERISAASTYTDRASAEQAVGAAIAANHNRIEEWVARSGGHPNLVLDYESGTPIGRTLRRGDQNSRPCARAVVVLKWKRPADYYVLTSYPECR
jgi:hypothetical protein